VSQPDASLREGSVFLGRYQILRCLRAGGMGAVYECLHLTTRKRRALKVMLPHVIAGPGMRERFELEARVTAEIESEHIVETFDAGVDEATGAPFLVMELLRGDDLDRLVEERGPLRADEVVVLLAQAALALDRTHAAGIVHRDLKPQNLFLSTRDDGSPRLKILDFGIAKVVADGSRTAQQTAAIGTPLYMSPEQTTGDGHIGPAADLYALAHIAYALLSGQAYWLDEQQTLPMYGFLGRMIAGATEPPSVRAARRGVALPAAFDAWFARATARAPAQRFERATTQVSELAAALGTAAPRLLLSAPPSMGERLSSAPTPASLAGSARGRGGTTPISGPMASPFAPGRLSAAPGASGTMVPLLHEPVPAPPRGARAPWAALGIGALLAGALGLFLATRALGVQAPSAAGAPASASPAPTTSAPALPPASAAPQPMVLPASEPGALAAPSTEPVASAGPTPPAPTAKPRTRDRPAPAPGPAKDCDPPFVVDSAGHRHVKPQCL
jgi:serine/threonine-protein kinase